MLCVVVHINTYLRGVKQIPRNVKSSEGTKTKLLCGGTRYASTSANFGMSVELKYINLDETLMRTLH